MGLVNDVASPSAIPLAIVGAIMYTLWMSVKFGYTFQGGMRRPIVCAFF